MQAHVYASLRQADTYLYLDRRDGFDRVPATLRAQLEPLRFVLEVALADTRRLARMDAAQVRHLLQTQGWCLQMPPRAGHDPLSADHGTDA